jgi:hypothetical protein
VCLAERLGPFGDFVARLREKLYQDIGREVWLPALLDTTEGETKCGGDHPNSIGSRDVSEGVTDGDDRVGCHRFRRLSVCRSHGATAPMITAASSSPAMTINIRMVGLPFANVSVRRLVGLFLL